MITALVGVGDGMMIGNAVNTGSAETTWPLSPWPARPRVMYKKNIMATVTNAHRPRRAGGREGSCSEPQSGQAALAGVES